MFCAIGLTGNLHPFNQHLCQTETPNMCPLDQYQAVDACNQALKSQEPDATGSCTCERYAELGAGELSCDVECWLNQYPASRGTATCVDGNWTFVLPKCTGREAFTAFVSDIATDALTTSERPIFSTSILKFNIYSWFLVLNALTAHERYRSRHSQIVTIPVESVI